MNIRIVAVSKFNDKYRLYQFYDGKIPSFVVTWKDFYFGYVVVTKIFNLEEHPLSHFDYILDQYRLDGWNVEEILPTEPVKKLIDKPLPANPTRWDLIDYE